ncbi:MAG: hypothetical protein Q4E35_08850 [Eubacteriales bacterium]|nr:hypothetical protein [Eubacteriales bacterium]
MDKRLKLAGLVIEIHTLFDSIANTAEYETAEPPDFSVSITAQDIAAEKRKSMSECAYEGIEYPNYSPAALENTAVYRKIAEKLPEYDALVFHGSAVAVGEKTYLFTAKSGTGKTTHTGLWLKNIEGSYVVNGDKPILRIMDGKPFVCGTPWMGKEGYGCNKNVPLSAICFVNRETENRIEKTEFQKIYPRLIGQSYRPESGPLVAKTVMLLERIGACVPIYELFCNMEDEAAAVSFRGMSDEKI